MGIICGIAGPQRRMELNECGSEWKSRSVGLKSFHLIPQELGDKGENHHEKDDADEGGTVADDQTGAKPCPDELTAHHDECDVETHQSGDEEDQEGCGVAGEVDDFRVGGGSPEFETEEADAGDGPEGSGAGPKKSIVEANEGAKDQGESQRAEASRDFPRSKAGTEQRVESDAEQEPGNDGLEKLVADLGHRPRSDEREDKRQGDGPSHVLPVNQTRAMVAHDRRERPPSALRLVRAQCQLWRQSHSQKGRHRDETATSCDGIDEPRTQCGGKEQRVVDGGHAG